MATEPRAVLAWLRAREEELAALVLELVAAESPSTEIGSEQAALGVLAAELRRAGYRTRRVAGSGCGDHLYAVPRARRRGFAHQLIVGHVDTVWPMGTLQRMPPRVEDGRLYGPGAYDMKGGLAQLAFALRALHELGAEPSVTPVVFVNADEEMGSADSRRWIRLLAAGADRAFVLEPPEGADGRLKTGRKGVGRFGVTILGRAAHAGSTPEQGVSAILELAHQVERLFGLNDPARGITVNVGTIDGGLRPNVVAPKASALVDVRAPTHDSARQIEHAIRSLRPTRVGLSIEVEGGFGRPPMPRTDANRALERRAQILGRTLGLTLAEAPMVGGGSDANFTSLLAPTLDGLGALGAGAHAVDEHVLVSALPERAALLALLLLEPAGIASPKTLSRNIISAKPPSSAPEAIAPRVALGDQLADDDMSRRALRLTGSSG
jgi:glutamate carboxypeptidase